MPLPALMHSTLRGTTGLTFHTVRKAIKRELFPLKYLDDFYDITLGEDNLTSILVLDSLPKTFYLPDIIYFIRRSLPSKSSSHSFYITGVIEVLQKSPIIVDLCRSWESRTGITGLEDDWYLWLFRTLGNHLYHLFLSGTYKEVIDACRTLREQPEVIELLDKLPTYLSRIRFDWRPILLSFNKRTYRLLPAYCRVREFGRKRIFHEVL